MVPWKDMPGAFPGGGTLTGRGRRWALAVAALISPIMTPRPDEGNQVDGED